MIKVKDLRGYVPLQGEIRKGTILKWEGFCTADNLREGMWVQDEYTTSAHFPFLVQDPRTCEGEDKVLEVEMTLRVK